MLQILLDHLFRHLPYRDTEIPPRPKMSAPVLLPQMRKFLKQLARRPPLDPPHDLARRHVRRTTRQNMDVVFTHHPLHYPDLERLAGLSHQLPDSLRYLSCQNLVAVLRYPYKVIFNLKYRMTTISLLDAAPPSMRLILAAKADRLKPVV